MLKAFWKCAEESCSPFQDDKEPTKIQKTFNHFFFFGESKRILQFNHWQLEGYQIHSAFQRVSKNLRASSINFRSHFHKENHDVLLKLNISCINRWNLLVSTLKFNFKQHLFWLLLINFTEESVRLGVLETVNHFSRSPIPFNLSQRQLKEGIEI